jgi:hypothetical protein
MARYVKVAKPTADRWEYDALVPDLSVPEHKPVNTGLL